MGLLAKIRKALREPGVYVAPKQQVEFLTVADLVRLLLKEGKQGRNRVVSLGVCTVCNKPILGLDEEIECPECGIAVHLIPMRKV